jgi:hypothetical protein
MYKLFERNIAQHFDLKMFLTTFVDSSRPSAVDSLLQPAVAVAAAAADEENSLHFRDYSDWNTVRHMHVRLTSTTV